MTEAPVTLRRMQRLVASERAFEGTCFRCLSPRYANVRDAISGEGSRYAAGRFHVKGAFLIVYTACSLDLALWEYTHTARSRGFDVAQLLPVMLLSLEVKLTRVLDLTDAATRRALKINLPTVRMGSWEISEGESATQQIGRLASEAGFEAILAPSAGKRNNLNVLPANLSPDSIFRIINEQELPVSGG